MNEGWIKLHRSIMDHWIWESPHYLKWWLDLLMMANHKDNEIFIDGKVTVIKRGCRHTSLRKLAERWGVDKKTVSKFLTLLENEKMVHTERTTKGTTYKVCKYEGYQDFLPSKNPHDIPHGLPHGLPPNNNEKKERKREPQF